jgi:hypothetical protein
MDGDQLYKVTWEAAFEEFLEAVEHFAATELPDDARLEERQFQEQIRNHLQEYRLAEAIEKKKENQEK